MSEELRRNPYLLALPDLWAGLASRVIVGRVKLARKIHLTAIALLIVRKVASALAILPGAFSTFFGAGIVFAVQMFCSGLAGANRHYYIYILILTLLFTILPATLGILEILNYQKTSPIARLWMFVPETISFVPPLVLLLIGYRGVGPPDSAVSVRPREGIQASLA